MKRLGLPAVRRPGQRLGAPSSRARMARRAPGSGLVARSIEPAGGDAVRTSAAGPRQRRVRTGGDSPRARTRHVRGVPGLRHGRERAVLPMMLTARRRRSAARMVGLAGRALRAGADPRSTRFRVQKWTCGADPGQDTDERRRPGQHLALLADEHRRPPRDACARREPRTEPDHRVRAEDGEISLPVGDHGCSGTDARTGPRRRGSGAPTGT